MGSKTLRLLLSGLVFSGSVYAQSESSSRVRLDEAAAESPRLYNFKGDFSVDVGGATRQEGKDTSDGAYVYLSSNLEFRLIPELKLKLTPLARFWSARDQDRFKDDDNDSFIFLTDAYVGLEPVRWLELRGGMLSQRVLRTSMMVSNWATFPGVQTRLKSEVGPKASAELIHQYTIPTSKSGSGDREKSEALPAFQTLHLDVRSNALDGWELEAYGGYYEWSKLPSKVAIQSAKMGNSYVDGELVTKFTRGFRGYFGGGEACYCKGPVGFAVEYKRMTNIEADANAADGQWIGGGPRFKFRDMELDLRVRSYFIESDSTVAYYNKSRLGHTNRVGENIEAYLRFPKQRFAVYGEMYNARPIARDVNQRDLQSLFFGVETDNVSFF